MATDVAPPGGSHLPGVHGLRGVAALSIVFFHVAYVPVPNLALPMVLQIIVPALWMGVPLFFVISALSLMWTNADRVSEPEWIGRYLVRRFFRIAPLFYCMGALYACQAWAGGSPIAWSTTLLNLTFCYNFFPDAAASAVWAGWTIGVEMPFYCLLPVIVLSIRTNRGALWLTVVALTVSVAARFAIANDLALPAFYATASLISNLGIFAIGIGAFFVVTTVRRGIAVPACVAGFAATAGALLCGLGTGYITATLYPGSPELPLFAVGAGMLCIWQALAPSPWLKSYPMQWLGERSFSIYLVHPLIIWVLDVRGVYRFLDHSTAPYIGPWSYMLDAGAALAIVLPVSAMTYRIIEAPGRTLGRMLLRDKPHAPTVGRYPTTIPVIQRS